MKEKNLVLSRRGFLVGAAAVLSTPRFLRAADPCTLIPQAEEGPYYIDFEKVRRDVTEGRPGVPVQLRIVLLDAKSCAPIENAAVDIWHCDALGTYSGFTAAGGGERSAGVRGGRGGRGATDETRFLRGVQVTNKQGVAEFLTVYPGWYAGRTIHVHLKAHIGGRVAQEQYTGGTALLSRRCHRADFQDGAVCESLECSPHATSRRPDLYAARRRAVHFQA